MPDQQTRSSTPPVATKRARRSVHPLDGGIVALAAVCLGFSFFGFYKYTVQGTMRPGLCRHALQVGPTERPRAARYCSGDVYGAWHGIFGWLGVVLVVLAATIVATVVLAPRIALPAPGRLLAAVAATTGLLALLVALWVIPPWPALAELGVGVRSDGRFVAPRHDFSYWVVLACAAAAAGLCWLRHLPTRPRR